MPCAKKAPGHSSLKEINVLVSRFPVQCGEPGDVVQTYFLHSPRMDPDTSLHGHCGPSSSMLNPAKHLPTEQINYSQVGGTPRPAFAPTLAWGHTSLFLIPSWICGSISWVGHDDLSTHCKYFHSLYTRVLYSYYAPDLVVNARKTGYKSGLLESVYLLPRWPCTSHLTSLSSNFSWL